MRIGIPREVKDQEFRVGMTPAGVALLVAAGHQVLVEQEAGARIGYDDAAYRQAGAHIAATAADIYATDLVVKVKEPQPAEFPLLRPGLVLFCYLHLAAEPALAQALIERNVTAVAYETVEAADGSRPLLIPMSEIAGRLAVQAGAASLELVHGGRGVLLGGVPGVLPAKVLILGGGIVGTEAARMALGLGAEVTLVDINLARLRALDALFGGRLKTCHSQPALVEQLLRQADLLVGAVLIPGQRAPKLVSRRQVAAMQPGAVIVDVAIDQGGCIETSRPTTHTHPTYIAEGIVHYCVSNMPAAVSRTATQALAQATLPYVLQLANAGLEDALRRDAGLLAGLSTYQGHLTHAGTAHDLGYPYQPPAALLSGG